jgi:2-polyprenyl-6-methoxyphenol hydroxylase-like FAD-dependent oxidoreductase
MSLPENTTVLIVGAGPAGLTAALALAHHSCYDFVIVDAVVEGQNASRAITIHSATVEVRYMCVYKKTHGCSYELRL